MAERTENYSTRFVSQGYYSYLVELRAKCNMLLTDFDSSQDPEIQDEFKQMLTLLVREMNPKFDRREDMDRPETLENRDRLDMGSVGMDECREILRKVSKLQERLGITSMAKNEYEMDPMGEVDKNA